MILKTGGVEIKLNSRTQFLGCMILITCGVPEIILNSRRQCHGSIILITCGAEEMRLLNLENQSLRCIIYI
jgi:hypothetical protein